MAGFCVHQVLCDRICFLRRSSGASHSCQRTARSDRLPDAHRSRSGLPGLELCRGLLDGGLSGEPEQPLTHFPLEVSSVHGCAVVSFFSWSFRILTCPYHLAQRHKSRLGAPLFALSPAGLFHWLCQIQGAPASLPCSSSRVRGFWLCSTVLLL